MDASGTLRFDSKALVLMLWTCGHVMYRQADTLKVVLGNHPFEPSPAIKLTDHAVRPCSVDVPDSDM
jgi:hypothetical protein